MKITVALSLLVFSLLIFSQKVYPYDKWKSQELAITTNFEKVSYMDSIEKEI